MKIFQIFLVNCGEENSVEVNKKALKDAIQLKHRDVFTIIDRSFRLEIPDSGKGSPSKLKTPQKAGKMSPSPSKRTPIKDSKILTPKVSYLMLS
jgi:hypothetical protein